MVRHGVEQGPALIADPEFVAGLYERYAADLRRVRGEMQALYRRRGPGGLRSRWLFRTARHAWRRVGRRPPGIQLHPQLDDLEAEISYLLVRHFRPETLVEISPCGGWSSAWLLHALRDNGSGSLFSFDLVDLAPKNVPEELARGRWTFVQGDIRAHVDRLPPSIDYVFMDSDHSSAFCRWYIETIFRRLAPGTPVSVHDVFGGAACDPDGGEPEVILEWLRAVGVPFLTVSRADPSARAEVESVKRALGLEGVVHSADEQRDNPMIFFEIPGGRLDDPR